MALTNGAVQSTLPLPASAHSKPKAFIHRVRIKNYRNIAGCDVKLGQLMFLVGRNGAGKSNFLDALRLVTDALHSSLDYALRERGGIAEVRRRSSGHPNHFGIRLEMNLPDESSGWYGFEIAARPEGRYEVQREECQLTAADGHLDWFLVERGQVQKFVVTREAVAPPAVADRLYLVNAAGFPQFSQVYKMLGSMGFYNLAPERMRELQAPYPNQMLARDGANIASVMSQLKSQFPDSKTRIEEYLSKVVPGVESVDTRIIGPRETIEFRQRLQGAASPWRFLAANMSDGTLRVLGVLVALLQAQEGEGTPIPLVGIEEPEVALHPAAAGVVRDCLRDAAERRQVIVTSHSPDLLDDSELSPESILAVFAEDGNALIAGLEATGTEPLRAHLCTAGELLRQDQIEPDRQTIPNQLNLFSGASHD